MKKLIFIFSIIYCLSSCWYSNGCVYTPQMVNCYHGEKYPNIAHWQKKETLGKTNSEQRWIDLLQCKFIKKNEQEYDYPIQRGESGYFIGDINYISKILKKLDNCMYQKGYYIEHDCGTQHPKWSTGKCNI